MTYAELDQKTNQLARHLRVLGVDRDVPVAVLMERSFDIIIAVMGKRNASWVSAMHHGLRNAVTEKARLG